MDSKSNNAELKIYEVSTDERVTWHFGLVIGVDYKQYLQRTHSIKSENLRKLKLNEAQIASAISISSGPV